MSTKYGIWGLGRSVQELRVSGRGVSFSPHREQRLRDVLSFSPRSNPHNNRIGIIILSQLLNKYRPCYAEARPHVVSCQSNLYSSTTPSLHSEGSLSEPDDDTYSVTRLNRLVQSRTSVNKHMTPTTSYLRPLPPGTFLRGTKG